MRQLKPLTTPQQLRDATIRDYRNNMLRLGLEPNMEAITKLAIADCMLVDAYYRDDQPHLKPKAKAVPKPRSNELTEHLIEHDISVDHHAIPEKEPAPHFLDLPANLVGVRWSAACARIMRILEPRGDVKAAAETGQLEKVIQEAAYPKLARMFLDVWLAFLFRGRRRYNNKPNPFYGCSDAEAAKIFVRAVEDICDKSTAEPGLRHWWVK